MARIRVVSKPEVCIGCHLCEIWCSVAHSKSKDIIKAFLYEQPRPQPRILVEEKLPETYALQCRHCQEPKCVAACIAGALYKDEEGIVVHIIAIDGLRGGTGAAPKMIRNNVGIPIEFALAAVDQRLRDEGIRNKASILVAGGFRCSADVVKAIALGADAVYIGTPALVAMGCTLCQKCHTGICNWGICTQDDGEIIVHGRAGDVVAMAMRGGRIMIGDDVGYRAAIHMKEYKDKVPVLIVGGTAQDFFGEYMAGGRVVLLGLSLGDKPHRARYIGTGMHGGIMYIRGKVEQWQLGKEVGIVDMEKEDWKFLEKHIGDCCREFGFEKDEILGGKFLKLKPVTKRPYGRIYAY